MEKVVDHYRLENVQLEVSLRPGKTDRSIISEYLYRNHRHRFGLRWIYFSRHDRASRFVLRQSDLTYSAPWSRRQPANVVSDLHQRTGKCLQCARREY